MNRLTYKAETAFGQMTAEAVNNIKTATHKLVRTLDAVNMMNEESCELEMGVPKDQFDNFRKQLRNLQEHLLNDSFQVGRLDEG